MFYLKKSSLLIPFFLISGIFYANAQKSETNYTYSVPQKPWNESYGNHRAILKVDKADDIVSLDYQWRRADNDVAKRRFVIVNAISGDTVKNIKRVMVDNEKCQILFGPVKEKGLYYFYYLPYKVQKGGGFYGGGYLSQEEKPEQSWVKKSTERKSFQQAKVMNVEARTKFDSFYPMEIAATKAEMDGYKKNLASFYLFPEDRKNPIRMRHSIPASWLKYKQGLAFKGNAAPNEYYTFQVGVWAPFKKIENISYNISNLRNGKEIIPASKITCFNLEGVDSYGKEFKKSISIEKNSVQPLWFGVDINKDIKKGTYKGILTISSEKGLKREVPISITISGKEITDRGDSEPWRHSRLRWLNSTLGIADTPTAPYKDVTVDGNKISVLGRDIILSKKSVLPQNINSWGNEILSKPLEFVIETSEGIKNLKAVPVIKEHTVGHVLSEWKAEDNELTVSCKANIEFDGWMNYIFNVNAKKDIAIKDIRLELAVDNNIAKYFLGAGLHGEETPNEYEGKWDAPEKTINNFGVSIPTDKKDKWLWPFDSFWIGNANAGIHCELRGSSYTGPLLNSYHPAYPKSWDNNGKGGFRVKKGEKETLVTVYSGERNIKAGESQTFDFAMIITPVKPVDMKGQFTNRYYHNGSAPVPTDEDVKAGVKVINVHHANEYNPFINYPFLSVDKVKAFTNKWHEKGCKVKLYYTLRELTSATTEIWAIRSLGHEILRGGNGGGFPWCREHFVTDYTPQWYQHFEHIDETGITADAAILTSESNSRWYNYYVEGLRWMVENMDIDGIYLDDVSFDRRILKRMRRAMDSVKPGCIIDLHSNTGFSKGPANQYTEFFPYVDKLWFGESFQYDKMSPANYLVESSGIPFGLTSDMLHRGGNKWLGMQYGMTVRHPWLTEGIVCDPRVVWKIWDDFNIADSKMTGFWEKDVPVTTTDSDVKVTAYQRGNRVLLSVGNYTDETKKVKLNIDFKKLGISATDVRLVAPEIADFQKAQTWNIGDEITVAPRKGWLIYIN